MATPAEGDGGGRVGLVLAGGGARGAYEMGALSVLLPALAERGELPTVIVGTSVGALNGTWLAGADPSRSATQTVEDGLAIWRELHWKDVAVSAWSPRSAVPLLRYVGGIFSPHIRVEYLLDSKPLKATLEKLIAIGRVGLNVSPGGPLRAVAVVATRPATGRTVVFHTPGPDVQSDEARGIDYVTCRRLTRDHVRASAAFPAVFRPVKLPDPAGGWYIDGCVRLNTPIKPALELGAERLVVVALNAPTPGPAPPDDRSPDVFDGLGQLTQALWADPLAHDVRTLAKVNERVRNGDRNAKLVPYILIEPKYRDRIGEIVRKVFAKQSAKWSWLLQSAGLVGRLLHADASRGSGELFSYVFFAPELAEALIKEGRDDAEAWLDRHDHEDGIWRHRAL